MRKCIEFIDILYLGNDEYDYEEAAIYGLMDFMSTIQNRERGLVVESLGEKKMSLLLEKIWNNLKRERKLLEIGLCLIR